MEPHLDSVIQCLCMVSPFQIIKIKDYTVEALLKDIIPSQERKNCLEILIGGSYLSAQTEQRQIRNSGIARLTRKATQDETGYPNIDHCPMLNVNGFIMSLQMFKSTKQNRR